MARSEAGSALRRWARRLGVAAGAGWLRETVQIARNRRRNARYEGRANGLPLPPPRLILRVAGTPDIEWFLLAGAAAYSSLRDALAAHGADLEHLGAVLDFGCGCGRVTRHWAGASAAIHGCDYNRSLVRWCRGHLPFARFEANGLRPPLPFAGETFGLVYALSVFTHLPADLQRPWMAELRRVLAPGGWLVLSVHGQRYASELTEAERERFDRGELVVRAAASAGTNRCGAYHPPAYVSAVLAEGFDAVAHLPEGAAGNPHQDLVVLRKPAA